MSHAAPAITFENPLLDPGRVLIHQTLHLTFSLSEKYDKRVVPFLTTTWLEHWSASLQIRQVFSNVFNSKGSLLAKHNILKCYDKCLRVLKCFSGVVL